MATFIINHVVSLFGSFISSILVSLGIIKRKNTVDMNKLRINVRFNGQISVPLDINPQWTISQMKETLSSKLNVLPEDLSIIFAGKELDDDLCVENCDIGQQSILHAVRARNRAPSLMITTSKSSLLHESIASLQLSEDEQKTVNQTSDKRKVNFYVYCSGPCKDVCPGKLRVRCSYCKQGTLTVIKDPCCWDDVLIAGRIPGVCQADNCSGDAAEFYFKCSNHESQDQAVALYLIKNNFRDVPCLACTEVSKVILVFPCAAKHVICLDCFREYCISRLNERNFKQDENFGYTLPCAVGCTDSLIKETHHFKLLGEEHYARYQRFAAEEYLLQVGGVLCPFPGCGAGILPDPECRRIVCVKQGSQGCGFVFCRLCLQGYHIGRCEPTDNLNTTKGYLYVFNDENVEQARWEEDTKNTIKSTTKPCPKCRTPTEKDGGCMHMVCTRPQCGYHWCWMCQTEWTRECMGNHWFG
ncbi:E3 ubiquitin-protein ligase parkin isoform X1 [Tachypleus tridentatus]|uniref:E3 ubiquitin-protein ligase parkin isoform X1 n=1 Tax=Tachypleus tridentatus TaxID=6853 RepID=UPI003FD19871